jgi:hypothetical protein
VVIEATREDFRLRRVVAVAHRFSDGVWVTSAEVWDHCIVIRWAKPEQAPGPHLPVAALALSDDLGTSYALRGGGASRTRCGSLGHAEFEPYPSPAATSLQIRDEATGDVASISLAR